MHTFSKNLGDKVRAAREAAQMSQNELAEKLNVDVRTIINIENYRGNPKMVVLFPLIRELKILPDEIFYPENDNLSEGKKRILQEVFDCSETELEAILPVVHSFKEAIRARGTETKK